MMSDKASNMLSEALDGAYTYLGLKYKGEDLKRIEKDLLSLSGTNFFYFSGSAGNGRSYENLQAILATLNENEKEAVKKSKGIYYTPGDVVRFIVENSIKSVFDKLEVNRFHVMDLSGIPYNSCCTAKLVLDPTCGTGEFLLAALNIKFDLLDNNIEKVSGKEVRKVVSTVFGNDTNSESTAISKIRLYLCAVKRYGLNRCSEIVGALNNNFTNKDFISNTPDLGRKFDLIIGNPPFIEDSKCNLNLSKKYGNVYANVLMNSAEMLNDNGALGFVIPLSYVSTPRMQSVRNDLFFSVPEQFIFSYSDRPDCLFKSVHQKLCILIAKKRKCAKRVFTGNYRYWYKEERENLFNHTEAVKNNFAANEFIPKLGNTVDTEIYKKIQSLENHKNLAGLQGYGTESVYLNMRAAFWIKAFRRVHHGAEYKQFKFDSAGIANYFFCLINSSLFWWYWICVSDCWHITKKELQGFNVPELDNFETAEKLAAALENRLEETKLYVGTKQTDYEYKHRSCAEEIHDIDDYINALYGLTDAENLYIKNFAYRYRVSGGAK
ncbi:MAG: SAM-dependent methyltransferase [Ruminococcus sp.]|nr:SAM-dependent methyltransferase [Ruminococcus sp.]MCM1380849.1 SAM-dependent methyltransferase [Muribaculaceae bacterium]MCM1479075.1 SAM-dependent methyltransferase [Muribaculaceae bacterium]